jgi:phosphohistidine phosphatase
LSKRLVYLMRHAKSSWDDPDLADHDRPLSARGLKAAARMAELILREEIAPALILCSSARRARETLAPIRQAIGDRARVEVEEGLYGAGADQLLHRLRQVPSSAASVMVIGHNPGIQELAVNFVGDQGAQARLRVKFPTAALAVLGTDIPRWAKLNEGGAELLAFLRPRD